MEQRRLKGFLKNVKLNESTISMILGALVIIVVGALIFNYFRGVERPEEEKLAPEEIQFVEEEGRRIPQGLPTEYQVKEGDDLWKIAEKFYGSGYNWVDISRENQLSNPNIIYVDQKLTIPRTAVIEPLAEVMTVFGPTIEGSQYEVQKGDHLWGIAVRAYGDGYQWTQLAQTNNIANPNYIDPGDVLTIPRK
jgi:nucleoid-associated protein YgaU